VEKPTNVVDSKPNRPVSGEGIFLALCIASLAGYLCYSVAIRAFFKELCRLGGKFLG